AGERNPIVIVAAGRAFGEIAARVITAGDAERDRAAAIAEAGRPAGDVPAAVFAGRRRRPAIVVRQDLPHAGRAVGEVDRQLTAGAGDVALRTNDITRRARDVAPAIVVVTIVV